MQITETNRKDVATMVQVRNLKRVEGMKVYREFESYGPLASTQDLSFSFKKISSAQDLTATIDRRLYSRSSHLHSRGQVDDKSPTVRRTYAGKENLARRDESRTFNEV